MPGGAFIMIGGVFASTAVALGALGAHTFKPLLDSQQLETFHTAVHYQMIHAIGLIVVGLLDLDRRSAWWRVAGWCMVAGVVLFSGFLYFWVATGIRTLMYLVPLGGTAFIIGWASLALGAWQLTRD